MSGKSNAKIRTMDIPVLDKVLGMEDGYVLNFSNPTFSEFFREELRVDIDDPRWAVHGGSKAKRLRYYLRQANRKTILDTLNALWEYREASSVTHNYPELGDTVRAAFFRIIERLGGTPPVQTIPCRDSRHLYCAEWAEVRVNPASTPAGTSRMNSSTPMPGAGGAVPAHR